jgi:DNA-nicking Smr family endonuclease
MDFGAILDKWERQTPGNTFFDKDALNEGAGAGGRVSGERRSRLLRKKPDAYIDLHGLTREEAWSSLEVFFENSRNKGFEKVQIIHGKGSHGSSAGISAFYCDEGTLRDLSRRFIEICSLAGENGYCPAREGGSGATWVILKKP